MASDILLEKLNRYEGCRYLGYGNNKPDENIMSIIDECENEILENVKPRYVYKIFDITERNEGILINGTSLLLKGESIKEHLKECQKIIAMCGTLSVDIDKIIKKAEINDMAKAVILDAFSAVAVEQLMDKVEEKIKNIFSDKYFTYRFGIGYGDLPIEQMPDFLNILNAGRLTGVTVSRGGMMTPLKSVACVVGISDFPIKSKKKGCITCNMKDKCEYRIRGERCGF